MNVCTNHPITFLRGMLLACLNTEVKRRASIMSTALNEQIIGLCMKSQWDKKNAQGQILLHAEDMFDIMKTMRSSTKTRLLWFPSVSNFGFGCFSRLLWSSWQRGRRLCNSNSKYCFLLKCIYMWNSLWIHFMMSLQGNSLSLPASRSVWDWGSFMLLNRHYTI